MVNVRTLASALLLVLPGCFYSVRAHIGPTFTDGHAGVMAGVSTHFGAGATGLGVAVGVRQTHFALPSAGDLDLVAFPLTLHVAVGRTSQPRFSLGLGVAPGLVFTADDPRTVAVIHLEVGYTVLGALSGPVSGHALGGEGKGIVLSLAPEIIAGGHAPIVISIPFTIEWRDDIGS